MSYVDRRLVNDKILIDLILSKDDRIFQQALVETGSLVNPVGFQSQELECFEIVLVNVAVRVRWEKFPESLVQFVGPVAPDNHTISFAHMLRLTLPVWKQSAL